MGRPFFIFACAWVLSSCGGQRTAGEVLTPDSLLNAQLHATSILREPLPLDVSRSLEAEQWQKPVLISAQLPILPSLERWRSGGLATLSYAADSILRMALPVETGRRATGPSNDPDYATYGRANCSIDMQGSDLTDFNRITMEVCPQCEGTVIMNLNLTLRNASSGSLGSHLLNLVPNQWNKLVFEMEGLQRDHVQSIAFYTDLKGRNQATCDSLVYLLRNICLEKVERPDKEVGWQPEPNRIVYSMSGYLPSGMKTALVEDSVRGTFSLKDAATGECILQDTVKTVETTLGRFGVLDFSSIQRVGSYVLQIGQKQTPAFRIAEDAFTNAQWRLLNYIFCQRCGWAVPGIHGVCHTDLFCDFEGKSVPYGGGWHDAGDLSQQTLQTGDVAYALLEAYEKQKGCNSTLATRLLEEAEWGLRFVLRCRLGGGYHASSMGLLHWTDGIEGTSDDIHTVRKQNMAYDNFLYSAYEAYAASVMPSGSLRDSLAKAAVEDYDYGMEKFQRDGFDSFPHIMEHTYNTSHAQFHATMSWAASQLFRLTHEERYANEAAAHIGYVLSCQEQEGPMPGYFYRDTTRQSIVHYIHQSREQLFMQSLVSLCETQPEHPDYPSWHEAIRLYAQYLKRLSTYTAPYGMLPSGVYQTEEYRDSSGFYALHLFAPREAPQLYERQIRQGVALDEHHFVRRFPVWFGIFNGNEAVLLSTGKAAAVCGRFLGDDELRQLGREQLYWTVGKNPFCQSLIYGEGHRYPSMDSFSSGEIVGEIPVGIRSMGNDDVPYWPQTNNACYKEVWLTSAGKFLSLLAELTNL